MSNFSNCSSTLTEALESLLKDINIIDYLFVTRIPTNDYFEDDNFRANEHKNNRRLEQMLFDAFFARCAIQLPYDIDDRIELINKTINNYEKYL